MLIEQNFQNQEVAVNRLIEVANEANKQGFKGEQTVTAGDDNELNIELTYTRGEETHVLEVDTYYGCIQDMRVDGKSFAKNDGSGDIEELEALNELEKKIGKGE